jgi:hypothetical protein
MDNENIKVLDIIVYVWIIFSYALIQKYECVFEICALQCSEDSFCVCWLCQCTV